MIHRPQPFDPNAPVVVIDIGNTATKVGTWQMGQLRTPLSAPTADVDAFNEIYAAHFSAAHSKTPVATVIGSVVPAALDRIKTQISLITGNRALVIGDAIPLPIELGVTDAKAIGVDRICEAAAAFETLQRACTIVAFGSAVTIDLVDDDGTFVGGAIIPGLRMQLRALHEFTAQLPDVEPGCPELPYGRNTIEAMQSGVCRGLAGAVRNLVEAYSTYLGRWPQVVATGGDAAFMAPHCDFLDTIVSDLVLRGVGVAYSKYLASVGA